jgi:hypothetical protein
MRHASAALVPVAAALAGVAVPAACYLAVTGGHPAVRDAHCRRLRAEEDAPRPG